MIRTTHFKDRAWRHRALKIHTVVSLALSHHIQTKRVMASEGCVSEGYWLVLEKKVAQEALEAIDTLDALLDTGDSVAAYREQHRILWELLKALNLDVSIGRKIRYQFGFRCFLYKTDGQPMQVGCDLKLATHKNKIG